MPETDDSDAEEAAPAKAAPARKAAVAKKRPTPSVDSATESDVMSSPKKPKKAAAAAVSRSLVAPIRRRAHLLSLSLAEEAVGGGQ